MDQKESKGKYKLAIENLGKSFLFHAFGLC